MNDDEQTEASVLRQELPDARVRDVIDAAAKALLEGDQGLRLKAIDPDGDALETAVTKAVNDALAISPLKSLLKAWKGMKQVADLIGSGGPEDGKPRSVTMASHTLKIQFTPGIVVELGTVAEVSKLPIPVVFSLKLEGVILTIVDRVITEIAAGRAKPTVEVKIEGITIVKENLPTVNLPLALKGVLKTPEMA